jgi:NAD(P)-dependent dehydrogenase (short-subunit alcohol dehydrogenase family)
MGTLSGKVAVVTGCGRSLGMGEAFGRLDILANCAATTVGIGSLLEVSEAAWHKSFDVNVTGPFHAIRAAIPEMLEVGGGRIVNLVTEEQGGQPATGATAPARPRWPT